MAKAPSQGDRQPQQVTTVTHQQYQGLVPPPEMLVKFEEVVPGTAKMMLELAEAQTRERLRKEAEEQAAAITFQSRKLDLEAYRLRSVFRSDALGQILGFTVCLACAAGALWLGILGQWQGCIALAAIPTAAIVQSFRLISMRKTPEQQKPQPPGSSSRS